MQFLFRVKSKGGYQQATLHPWPCLAFSLPFLAIYEGGLVCLGHHQQDSIRTGADTWLHWVLAGIGLTQYFWTAAFILLFLGVWAWRARKGRPSDLIGICTGMAVESIVFALLLCGLSRGVNALIARASGVILAESASTESTLQLIVTYMGAGIYEELIFRLLLFSATLWLLYHVRLSGKTALFVAALSSSLLFAAAHHFGPHGEDFDARAFFFRALAGLYFTFVFYYRGFGIAAGSHAVYDVIVGILAM